MSISGFLEPRTRKSLSSVVVTAVLIAAIVAAFIPRLASAAPVLGGQLYSGGECDITVEVLPATAGYTSNLLVYLDDGTLFRDTGLTNSMVGSTDTFTGPAAGEELVFAIYVQDTGDLFKMGPGARNDDGLAHATVNDNGDGSFTVGFEDLYGGGDQDYDDNVFKFTGCVDDEPEPKVFVCHATASATNPWVLIHINESAVPAHVDDPSHNKKSGNKDYVAGSELPEGFECGGERG